MTSDGRGRSIDNDVNNEKEAADEERKKRLLREIDALQRYIARGKATLALSRESEPLGTVSRRLPNVETEITRELHRLSGVHCAKFDGRYVFEFTSGREVTREHVYCVEILNEAGQGRLGKWAMPMSVDLEHILRESPISDLKNLKEFVMSCKRYVDSYVYRRDQFRELKEITSGVRGCFVDADLGFTWISVRLFGVRRVDADETYNVEVYLYYKPSGGRPFKLDADSLAEGELSEGTHKKLVKHFKPFRELDLRSAFERVTGNAAAQFAWEKLPIDDEDVHVDVESDTELDRVLKTSRKGKGAGGKRKAYGDDREDSRIEDRADRSATLHDSLDAEPVEHKKKRRKKTATDEDTKPKRQPRAPKINEAEAPREKTGRGKVTKNRVRSTVASDSTNRDAVKKDVAVGVASDKGIASNPENRNKSNAGAITSYFGKTKTARSDTDASNGASCVRKRESPERSVMRKNPSTPNRDGVADNLICSTPIVERAQPKRYLRVSEISEIIPVDGRRRPGGGKSTIGDGIDGNEGRVGKNKAERITAIDATSGGEKKNEEDEEEEEDEEDEINMKEAAELMRDLAAVPAKKAKQEAKRKPKKSSKK